VTGAPVRLLLLADTHIPVRARDLPAHVWAAVDAADVIVHAGDWVDVRVLDRLLERVQARGGRLIGVVGNNDGPALRARLPLVARAEVGGVRIAVVHETGAASGRDVRCAQAYPDVDLLVFGHSHIPWDRAVDNGTPGGRRLLNPGSPTDRRRQPQCSYLTATADAGRLLDVRLHLLPLSGSVSDRRRADPAPRP
jgi:putative phosphoesterase